MKTYCTYITHYTGSKLPKWYIGSSYTEKIDDGYNGSVSSKKYKDIYKLEQKHNKHLFKTRILSLYRTNIESRTEELRLQKLHSVVKNKDYFNMSYATINGFFGMDTSGENNPNYGKHKRWTKEQKDKVSGKEPWNKGRTKTNDNRIKRHALNQIGHKHSEETKNKISEKAKRVSTCPHCNKVGSISNMTRWHFDNCKLIN